MALEAPGVDGLEAIDNVSERELVQHARPSPGGKASGARRIAEQSQHGIGQPVAVLPAILDLSPLQPRAARPRPVVGMMNMLCKAKMPGWVR